MILANLTGIMSDNYFLSGSFYSLRCSEGAEGADKSNKIGFNCFLYSIFKGDYILYEVLLSFQAH